MAPRPHMGSTPRLLCRQRSACGHRRMAAFTRRLLRQRSRWVGLKTGTALQNHLHFAAAHANRLGVEDM